MYLFTFSHELGSNICPWGRGLFSFIELKRTENLWQVSEVHPSFSLLTNPHKSASSGLLPLKYVLLRRIIPRMREKLSVGLHLVTEVLVLSFCQTVREILS